MPDHVLSTSAGPVILTATEPVPGLHVYEIPSNVSPLSEYRWILAHHDGHTLAAFKTEDAATDAAGRVAPLADWTRNVMTTANQVGPSRADQLMNLLVESGGQHPNT